MLVINDETETAHNNAGQSKASGENHSLDNSNGFLFKAFDYAYGQWALLQAWCGPSLSPGKSFFRFPFYYIGMIDPKTCDVDSSLKVEHLLLVIKRNCNATDNSTMSHDIMIKI